MLKTKLFSAFNSFTTWFSPKQKNYSLKIVDSTTSKSTQEKFFVIQYTGRALVRKYSLSSLLSDPKILGALSPKDAQYVIHSYHEFCSVIIPPRYSLQSIKPERSSKTGKSIFAVLDRETNTVYNKTSEEIVNDPSLHGKFNALDWYTISRLNGVEFVYEQEDKLKSFD